MPGKKMLETCAGNLKNKCIIFVTGLELNPDPVPNLGFEFHAIVYPS